MSALGQKRTFNDVRRMTALPPKADILGSPKKERDRHNGRSPPIVLAFGSNRGRRRGFPLAVRCVGLCGGCDAKESKRRRRQYSECFHGTLLCHDNKPIKPAG